VATEKAKALVAAGAARVRHHQPLKPTQVSVNPATLVIGGGIAGLQATLELADAGYHVYLVEREPSIGGHMAQLDKTFPTLDCSACILTPKMSEVGQHENITLLAYSELEEVVGSVGNFRIKIRRKARYVDEAKCNGCGICTTKCPTKVRDDGFEVGMGHRKAIYTPFPQAVPRIPVIDTQACAYFQRGKCRVCEKVCPTGAIDFNQQDRIDEIEVGNIILATGWKMFDCSKIPQYGYGRLPNVYTALEFERMVNAAGPTGGKIVLADGKTEPEAIAIIHCVGSRDVEHHSYCSNVCCMAALKFGHLILEKTNADVYSFYIDLRTPRKDYEEFSQRLLEEGMHFVRAKVAEVTDEDRMPPEIGKLIVQCEDTLLGRQRRVPVDMVILMGAIEPQTGAAELGRKCNISCGKTGWFIERHPKLDPVATTTDGVFIAGVCQGPKDIPASVAQGAAAAARVLSLIAKGTVTIDPITASIEEERCSGCRVCKNLCPYHAIEYDCKKNVCHVNGILCKGCGTCVAACPSGAIIGSHFTDDQIRAEIKGILWDAKVDRIPHIHERPRQKPQTASA
ncbi:MAG: CoB--CoM heterodisulfide reductase iron-sulfur subunit A family protein, partial [Pirellulales bacterium]|nr:CoB--CoM heterodisulfide reductase iron-sulfur subunit A family protein [Pirellulales bacterium]